MQKSKHKVQLDLFRNNLFNFLIINQQLTDLLILATNVEAWAAQVKCLGARWVPENFIGATIF